MKVEMWEIPNGRKRQLFWFRKEVSSKDEINNLTGRNNGRTDCYCTISHYSKLKEGTLKTFIDPVFTSILSDFDSLRLDKKFKGVIKQRLNDDFDSKKFNKIIDKTIELKKYMSYNDMLRRHKYYEDRSLMHVVFMTGRFFHIHLINSQKPLQYPQDCLFNVQYYFNSKTNGNSKIELDEMSKKGDGYWLDILFDDDLFEKYKQEAIGGTSFNFGDDKQLYGDTSRHGRLENTINPKSGLYCIPLTHEQIHSCYDEISKVAKRKNIGNGKDFFIGNKVLSLSVFDKMRIKSDNDDNNEEIFSSSSDDLIRLVSGYSNNAFVNFFKSITPPCMWRIFDAEPEHALRWQVVRFLSEVGVYKTNQIKLMFRKFKGIWDDYDEEITNKQIDGICEKALKKESEVRSCRSMKLLGLCVSGCKGMDDLKFADELAKRNQ